MIEISGLSDIVDQYDAFVIDQWGVLHDGRECYRGVVSALELLRDGHKSAVIATNSSKSADRNRDRLDQRFGIGRSLYSDLLSSAQLLRDALGAEFATVRHPIVIADVGDEVLVADAPLNATVDVDAADAVILLSVDPNAPTEPVRSVLARAAKRRLPLLMPSSDHSTVTVDGVFAGMGTLAEFYLSLGQTVHNFGKPSDIFYSSLSSMIGSVEPARVLAVGDQIASDVAGGARQGFHTLLVATGAGRSAFDRLRQENGRESGSLVVPTFLLETLQP